MELLVQPFLYDSLFPRNNPSYLFFLCRTSGVGFEFSFFFLFMAVFDDSNEGCSQSPASGALFSLASDLLCFLFSHSLSFCLPIILHFTRSLNFRMSSSFRTTHRPTMPAEGLMGKGGASMGCRMVSLDLRHKRPGTQDYGVPQTMLSAGQGIRWGK